MASPAEKNSLIENLVSQVSDQFTNAKHGERGYNFWEAVQDAYSNLGDDPLETTTRLMRITRVTQGEVFIGVGAGHILGVHISFQSYMGHVGRFIIREETLRAKPDLAPVVQIRFR